MTQNLRHITQICRGIDVPLKASVETLSYFLLFALLDVVAPDTAGLGGQEVVRAFSALLLCWTTFC